MWELAKERNADWKGRVGIHPLSGHVFCGYCGCRYRRATSISGKFWRCNQNNNKRICEGRNIREERLLEAMDGGDFERIVVYNDRLEMG